MSELHGNIGPTRNYENLTNLPSINGVRVVGNLTPSDLGLADDASVEEIRSALENKVDKVTGKGLSENDYTDGEKAKLEGIEAGAEKNVQSDWDASDGSDAFIKNKPSVLETVTIRGTATTKSGTNTDLDVYKTAEVDSAIDTLDNKIDTNVADLDERKAEIDGYYETFTSGQTEQLIATEAITDTEPYIYRKTGGPNDVGDRVYDELVGGSVVWNQIARNNVAGSTSNGITMTNNGDGSYTLNGTAEGGNARFGNIVLSTVADHVIFVQPVTSDANVRMWKIGHTYGYVTNAGAIHKFESTNSYDFIVSEGVTLNNVKVYPQCIDLTAALTPTIADYIYTLEQANAGAGVAWFKKYFPGIYFEFCEPHFEHVQVSAKNTVGFNQWDEEWVNGTYNAQGVITSSSRYMCSKNLIPVLPSTQYYLKSPDVYFEILSYDENKNYLRRIASSAKNRVVTMDDKTHYIAFGSATADAYTRYTPGDICINIHGDRDGEYEPYRKRTYPLDSSLTLRGFPKLDSANRLYFDGDIYEHDGTVTRRYPEIDMSTMAWSYDSTNQYFYTSTTDAMVKPANGEVMNIRTVKYVTVASISTISNIQNLPDKSIAAYAPSNSFRILVKDSAYTTLADFKASLSGQMLIYEAKTPTTETAEPFQSPMVVDPLGTEEFIDYGVAEGTRDVAIPVGHSSEYPADLRGKLQHLPSLASADGRYVVVQTGNQMSLAPDTSLGLIAALEARVAALEGGNG